MRADFYYIPDDDTQRFACRIAQKAFENQHQVYMHADSDEDANDLNKLLWTFQQNSFVPHGLVGEHTDDLPPVQIGTSKPDHHQEVLINLSNKAPDFAKDFQRVIEIVSNNDNQAETRKQHYQRAQFDIHEHDLRAKT
jgi:DNA polymerase III subunit chi